MSNYREWIIGLYKEYGVSEEANGAVYKHYEDGVKSGDIPEGVEKESFKRLCRRIRRYLLENDFFSSGEDDHDVIKHNLSLYKKNQRLQDLRRIEGKSLREATRVENALVELNKSFINLLKEQSFKNIKIKPFTYKPEEKVLMVSLSDLHTGEKINLEHNTYDYKVEGERLKLFALSAKEFGKFFKVKKIIVVGLGDLVNADTVRVLDKMLTNSDNRSKIEFIATYLISQFILDLAENFKIDVAFVVGNESRKYDVADVPCHELLLSHNSDHTIFNILKVLFKDDKRITFYNTPLDETVINVYGHNFLVTHGNNLKGSDSKVVDSVIRKYAMRGIILDYILIGHIHETYISNIVIRSGSTAGANKYAESKHYSSVATQNLIIVDEKTVTPIAINLQDTTGIEGYDYPKDIEEYNCMFDKESENTTTILKIVL